MCLPILSFHRNIILNEHKRNENTWLLIYTNTFRNHKVASMPHRPIRPCVPVFSWQVARIDWITMECVFGRCACVGCESLQLHLIWVHNACSHRHRRRRSHSRRSQVCHSFNLCFPLKFLLIYIFDLCCRSSKPEVKKSSHQVLLRGFELIFLVLSWWNRKEPHAWSLKILKI